MEQEEIMRERHAPIKPLLDKLAEHGEFLPMTSDVVAVINSYISPVFTFPEAFMHRKRGGRRKLASKAVVNVPRSFQAACKKAGITDFRFHDLRHTYASHLVMKGVHSRVLQELLGHKTPAMTSRYTHLAPAQLQGAVALLDGDIAPK